MAGRAFWARQQRWVGWVWAEVAARPAAGEQAVMADAVEAGGQHVDEEAADELVGVECHELEALAPFDAIVLPLEGDALFIERDQAAVGDGDAMGVARQIAQYFCGSPERAFAVDYPLTVAQ